jgi:hypothetical protein
MIDIKKIPAAILGFSGVCLSAAPLCTVAEELVSDLLVIEEISGNGSAVVFDLASPRDWLIGAYDDGSDPLLIIATSLDFDNVKVPFIIAHQAPSASLVIDRRGHTGLGTGVPNSSAKLHIVDEIASKLIVENPNRFSSQERVMFELKNNGSGKVRFAITSNGNNTWTFDNTPSANQFSISKVGTGVSEFTVSANGDGRFVGKSYASEHVNTSSRSSKVDFRDVQESQVLEKLASLPISSWRYKNQSESERHIGPVAEDFRATFNLGDGKTISTVDANGVALTAIKALIKENESLRIDNDSLRTKLAEQDTRLAQLESVVADHSVH